MTADKSIRWLIGGLLLFSVPFVAAVPAQAQQWDRLSPQQRYDTMQKYQEYENLPPKRREDIDKRYERWRKMPDEKREKVLRNYERYQQMPPAERRQFDRKYDRWREESRPRHERRGSDNGFNADRPNKKNKKQR